MKGRKPLPKEILKLRGTDRPDRQRSPSTILEPIKVDEIALRCQISGLRSATARARKIYWATVKRVSLLGIMEESFCSQLFFYAVEYDHFITCTESVKRDGFYITVQGKDGKPIVAPNPAVKQRENALEKLIKIGSNFGFSPVDRQRLKIQPNESKEKRIKAFFAAILEEDQDEGPEEQ